jgi:hypothetical protein
VFILKDFKSLFFGSAHSKGVTGGFCVSADSKGVSCISVTALKSTGADFSEKKEGESNIEGTEVTKSNAKMRELEQSEGAASGNELERDENMAEGSMKLTKVLSKIQGMVEIRG